MSRGARRLLAAVLLAVCGVSLWQLAAYWGAAAREEAAFARLAEVAAQASPDGENAGGMLPGYAALYAENPDMFGWLCVAGTTLNYPVMYTPDDPEYYLRRAFDGSYAKSGTPFLDAACYDGCGNYIIYGHNMKSGAMFAALLDYAERDFWQQHPKVSFDTLYEQGEYEVLAAFYAEAASESEAEAFRYWHYTDLTAEDKFNEYVDRVSLAALYDTGVTASFGDSLLTLSTCSYRGDNGRFVVVARRAADARQLP